MLVKPLFYHMFIVINTIKMQFLARLLWNQLSQRDCATRYQLKSCQLLHICIWKGSQSMN